jgi:hypothetical protein
MRTTIATGPTQFQYVAQVRLRESQILLREGALPGAVYLAGYVIECDLKAIISRRSGGRLPGNYYSHDLRALRAEVSTILRESDTQSLQAVPDWTPELRYASIRIDAKEATRFLNTVREAHRCLQRYL